MLISEINNKEVRMELYNVFGKLCEIENNPFYNPNNDLNEIVKYIIKLEENKDDTKIKELKEQVKVYKKEVHNLNEALKKRNKDISDYNYYVSEEERLRKIISHLESEIKYMSVKNTELRKVCEDLYNKKYKEDKTRTHEWRG